MLDMIPFLQQIHIMRVDITLKICLSFVGASTYEYLFIIFIEFLPSVSKPAHETKYFQSFWAMLDVRKRFDIVLFVVSHNTNIGDSVHSHSP